MILILRMKQKFQFISITYMLILTYFIGIIFTFGVDG